MTTNTIGYLIPEFIQMIQDINNEQQRYFTGTLEMNLIELIN
jgi:hypothetical protein